MPRLNRGTTLLWNWLNGIRRTGLDPEEPRTEHMRRKEQDLIGLVVKGEEPGHYFMLLGPKGG
ncbi:hypothetical protein DFP72DRAFT_1074602 [Ephemerocybe angulata]|nr:hypothetical protein DFP72DRAFT_1074602 [Tulosesus angulatus]